MINVQYIAVEKFILMPLEFLLFKIRRSYYALNRNFL